MDDSWFMPLWLQALIALVFFVAAVAVVRHALTQFFKGVGSWRKLAAVYATDRPMPEQYLSAQTIEAGRVLYRRCVSLGMTGDGLWLKLTGVGSVWRRSVLLIPWAHIRRIEQKRLFWKPAGLLFVGDPTVATLTLSQGLLREMRPWLPSHLQIPAAVA